jgi:NifB/MoaA-like Fe-S oxidoreductase
MRFVPSGVHFYNPPQTFMLAASSINELEEWVNHIKDKCASGGKKLFFSFLLYVHPIDKISHSFFFFFNSS